jgi:2-polyprenyl-3-methyl-5-hydroxy-6-metoxy-1,4-benzoquinol methylase
MTIVTLCAVCGRDAFGKTLLVHKRPDRFERHVGITEDGYRREWVQCNSCGAATNKQDPENARRLETLAADYYEVDCAGSSIEEKYKKVMSLPPVQSDNAGRAERILAMMTRVSEWLPQEGDKTQQVLDIGAGTGVFLARFLRIAAEAGKSWKGVAVEPDPNAAAHLTSLGQFDVIQALYQGQANLRGFDLVTLNKVVEHITNPVEFLRSVTQAIEPRRGVLYVEVPDVLTIGRRPATDNILGALHHHLYTPRSLEILLRRAGLEVLEIGRVFEPSGKITVFGFGGATAVIDIMARRYQ